MNYDKKHSQDTENWKELVRRMEALPSAESFTGADGSEMVLSPVPADDPTGFVELMETMHREHISEGLRLAREMPHFESIFNPVWPGDPRYPEAERACERIFSEARVWCAGYQRGIDYEIFSDVAGEVTAFHFSSEALREEFRAATGLDVKGGFIQFVDENFPR